MQISSAAYSLSAQNDMLIACGHTFSYIVLQEIVFC